MKRLGLGLTLVAGCFVGVRGVPVHREAIQTEDEGFIAAAQRVVESLRQENWAAFRKCMARQVTFEQYDRVFLHAVASGMVPDLNGLTTQQMRAVFPDTPFINLKDVEAGSRGTGAYALISLAVDRRQPISPLARRAFSDFCVQVKYSYSYPHPWVEIGTNLRADDGFPIYGPAVQGKYSSNAYWRVDMERRDGRWVATRLIETLH
ncbi:MAG: hypothetical protein HY321_09840 [Armatimonadetes bacterium]|nr:hypothetical protein [Armatimonadota bacterium]